MDKRKIKGRKTINIHKNKYKRETEILLVRHGYTPANNVAWNGQDGIRDVFRNEEDCPLDVRYGVEQASELGAFLAEYISGKKVLFLVSPYERAKQTIEIARKSFTEQSNLITYKKVDVLREINSGLVYGQQRSHFKDDEFEVQAYYDLKETNKRIAISFPNGESEIEVQRRLRGFSNWLKETKESGEYDTIIVLSHQIINKNLYFLLYDKEIGIPQKTASVIRASEKPEVIFEPETKVPKGYKVEFMEYPEFLTKKSNNKENER